MGESASEVEASPWRNTAIFVIAIVAALFFAAKYTGWRTFSPDEGGFGVQFPESPLEEDGSTRISARVKIGENYERRRFGDDGKVPFVGYKAEPARESFFVGNNLLPDDLLATMKDDAILEEVLEGSHLVGQIGVRHKPKEIESQFPPAEVKFGARAMGADYFVTKRAYLCRELKRAYVVENAVHTSEYKKKKYVKRRDRFFDSFEIRPTED